MRFGMAVLTGRSPGVQTERVRVDRKVAGRNDFCVFIIQRLMCYYSEIYPNRRNL